ncbi:hypothetical protein K435DRAFT_859091 [Dendrothele bispora CBS 962.96]|uniref:DUF6699 domain-containing protein n=1 Tax=Dendrothele bispora (strain CBS 962.96) TaxID=1314807 RepID=A0A4S8M2M0_DENBC|nr:hypothetical protein K435DRAFT_859091 [Dendrothele bispora CBS 962.96]
MYKTIGGFPHTPKIPNQDLPPSPSPVYPNTRHHHEYGSFTAPFPSTIPLRATTPLRASTPAPEHTRARRDSSSSRSQEQHTRMRATSGPNKAPLKSILKKTGASVVNIFRSSSRADITRNSAAPVPILDYKDFAPIPVEPPRSRGRTPVPVPVSNHHQTLAPSTIIDHVRPPSSAHRSRSRDHSSSRSAVDGSKLHRSYSQQHKYPGKPLMSSDSGASSDHEYVLNAHRSGKHHSKHHTRSRSSVTSSSDSGHMSDTVTSFKVKAIDNTPDVRHRSRRLPSITNSRAPLPPSHPFGGYGDIQKVRTKSEVISLNWPLMEQSRVHKIRQALPIYFDVAFEPWYSVQVWLPSEKRPKNFFPQHEDMSASSHCVLTKMNISCDIMGMWPVTVERQDGIRCIDIFDAIYKTYAKPITEKEKVILGAEILARSEIAFRQRIKDSPGLPYIHERQGMLRVDTLINKRIFGGLVQDGNEEDWKLILKDPRQT